jgi:hypothetical protein
VACCVKRKAHKKQAQLLLEAMYDSTEELGRRRRCPLDGSETMVAWFSHEQATLGYLRCAQGHTLPLIRRRR